MLGWARVWRPRRVLLFVVLLLLIAVASLGWGVEPFSLEQIDLSAQDLPGSLVAGVNAQGTRIFTYVNGLRMPICEIFWAKTAIMQPSKNGPSRATYGNLEPGSLMGVIRFLAEASDEYREDFHDQKLKAGYYTMRYAMVPGEDARDFLVLSPVSADADHGLVLSTDQLTRQGKLASGTDQPALLSLVTIEVGSKDLPRLRMDENGTCILQDKLHAKSNVASVDEVMVAVILVNPVSEENGS